jgi:hypothetical protein
MPAVGLQALAVFMQNVGHPAGQVRRSVSINRQVASRYDQRRLADEPKLTIRQFSEFLQRAEVISHPRLVQGLLNSTTGFLRLDCRQTGQSWLYRLMGIPDN